MTKGLQKTEEKMEKKSTVLLLVAHGSPKKEFFHSLKATLKNIQKNLRIPIELAFLESPPYFEKVAQNLALSFSHIILVPLLLSKGRHVTEDIPRVVQSLENTHPVWIEVLPPLGDQPWFRKSLEEFLLSLAASKKDILAPPQGDKTFHILWHAAYGYFRLFHRLEVQGLSHIPYEKKVIVVSNHPSYYDPILLCLAARRWISFLTWRALFQVPLLGLLLPRFSALPVDPNDPTASCNLKAFRTAWQKLEQGEWVGVFPEGGRTPLDKGVLLAPFRLGAFQLAYLTGSTILPVCITGAHRAWPRFLTLPRPGKIKVRFLPSLSVPKKSRRDISPKELENTSEKVRVRILAALQEEYSEVPSPYQWF